MTIAKEHKSATEKIINAKERQREKTYTKGKGSTDFCRSRCRGNERNIKQRSVSPYVLRCV